MAECRQPVAAHKTAQCDADLLRSALATAFAGVEDALRNYDFETALSRLRAAMAERAAHQGTP